MQSTIQSKLVFLLIFTVISLLISIQLGATTVSLTSLWHSEQTVQRLILLQLRLLRLYTGFLVGSLLALAGCQLQLLLRNPLAEPYILGTSAGATCFIVSAILLAVPSTLLPLAALVGASVSTLLLLKISAVRQQWSGTRLLLTGVLLATGWHALTSCLFLLSPDYDMQHMLYWLVGHLNKIDYPVATGIVCLLLGCSCMRRANAMNILTLGEIKAQTLGINCQHLRLQLFLNSTVCTALAVALAGNIGFIGLVVPHCIRLWLTRDYRLALPAAMVSGGSLLVLADTIGRSAFGPIQLPVGLLTSLLGIPTLMYLLRQQRV